eukprot:m.84623 g.84623  ORF g.84623 m.84623 type:complete len:92 (-) comp14812_c0_seq2:769-1044(-)
MCGQGICVGRKAALCAGTYFVILKKPSIAARRPEDYYTEMVKTDDHMRRVRWVVVTLNLAVTCVGAIFYTTTLLFLVAGVFADLADHGGVL